MQTKLTPIFFCGDNLPKYLFHYTTWGTLKNHILKYDEKRISFIAKRIDEYWKLKRVGTVESEGASDENQPKNDPFEFRGMVQQLNLLNTEKKVEDKELLLKKLNEIFVSQHRNQINELDPPIYGSTLTPYFFCFAGTCSETISRQITEWHDETANDKEGFTSQESGVIRDDEPVVIAFNTSKLLCSFNDKKKYSAIFGDKYDKLRRIELFKIGYYSSEKEDIKNKNLLKSQELSNSFNKLSDRIELGSERENNPTEQDWVFDACIYNKDKKYDLEDEYRLIFREASDFIFSETKTKSTDEEKIIQGIFGSPLETIPNSRSESDNVDQSISVCKFYFQLYDIINPVQYIAFPRDKNNKLAAIANTELIKKSKGQYRFPQAILFSEMEKLSNN